MFQPAWSGRGWGSTIECPPLGEPVYADREMWAKIVLNLVSNALKFTFTGGIDVRVAATDGHAELTVTDTGTGIDPGELPRLFERFHRIVGARSRTYEGSGIGLALVSELAELHGGTERRQRAGRGQHVHGARAVRRRAPAGRRGRRRRTLTGRAAGRGLPRRGDALARRAPGRRPRADGGDRRGSSSSTTTPTCASTSPLLADGYAIETAADGAIALEPPGPTRPTSC